MNGKRRRRARKPWPRYGHASEQVWHQLRGEEKDIARCTVNA